MRAEPAPESKYGMTFREIASVEGVSPQAIQATYHKAMSKIMSHPRGQLVLTAMIEAARKFQVSPIGCGSLECRAEFIELFALDDGI
jgi:hypothetical protein